MPLSKNMSHEEKVKELMQSYKDNGKIGNTEPKNEEDALRIANAIAYSSESLNFNLNNKNGIESMQEKLNELKKLIEEGFPEITEAKVSQTKYDQASQDNTLQLEDEKSYEEDRLNLEEILSQSTSFKKNYVKKVVKAVNDLIDGTEDIEGLVKTVKSRKKRIK